MADNKPEKKFSAGAVTATVWANEREVNGNTTTIKSVSISRNYKDNDDKWKTSNSYSAQDLQKLRLVAQKAYEYLVCNGNSNAGDSSVEEEVVR